MIGGYFRSSLFSPDALPNLKRPSHPHRASSMALNSKPLVSIQDQTILSAMQFAPCTDVQSSVIAIIDVP